VQAVRRRDVDVALVRQLATPPDCERLSLRREPFVLAVPASWTPGIDEPTDLASTVELPWIWLPRTISPDYHDQVVACCRGAGSAPDVRHTARSFTDQLAMVACGLGVALVPESAAHGGDATDSADVRFLGLERSATIALAAVRRRPAGPLVRDLVTSAQEVIDPEGRAAGRASRGDPRASRGRSTTRSRRPAGCVPTTSLEPRTPHPSSTGRIVGGTAATPGA
jgi:DNA-binding transcriptional LysR family regulator